LRIAIGLVAGVLLGMASAARAGDCAVLGGMAFEDGRVTSAEMVKAGGFSPPGATVPPIRYDTGVPRYDYLPEFCRVTASFSGDLKIEVWMPAAGWTGEFVPLSGGIYGGRIARYPDLAGALMTGAATAVGNNGHDAVPAPTPGVGASNAGYLREHPEKIAATGPNSSSHPAAMSGRTSESRVGA
jgi:feruloyl esterase